MSREPKDIQFYDFIASEFLALYSGVQQIEYLKEYLSTTGLIAKKVICEPYYFDRDYLAEFSHFYSTSTYEYSNACSRIHLFSSNQVDEKLFKKALAEDKRALGILKKTYLGFIVVRPLTHAPLGRTVLSWYPDHRPNEKRVTTARKYKVHIAGVELEIEGLAWQQQDVGVSACATIALWTLMHASALDEHHQIPTTAEITVAAHSNYSEGKHPFPSDGLTSYQICDSIIHYGLRPAIVGGDGADTVQDLNFQKFFSRRLFSHICSSFIRSGYPLLMIGRQFTVDAKTQMVSITDHTLCAVGFREYVDASKEKKSKHVLQFDEKTKYLYIHDDNLGPNVRFEVVEENDMAIIVPSPPKEESNHELFQKFKKFVPTQIIAAVHNDLRVSPWNLYIKAFNVADKLFEIWRGDYKQKTNVSFGIRFFKISDYLGKELPNLLAGKGSLLAETRLALTNGIPPLSLHVGIIRLGIGNSPVMDVICDTSQIYPIPFATLCFHSKFEGIAEVIESAHQETIGDVIRVFLDQ